LIEQVEVRNTWLVTAGFGPMNRSTSGYFGSTSASNNSAEFGGRDRDGATQENGRRCDGIRGGLRAVRGAVAVVVQVGSRRWRRCRTGPALAAVFEHEVDAAADGVVVVREMGGGGGIAAAVEVGSRRSRREEAADAGVVGGIWD